MNGCVDVLLEFDGNRKEQLLVQQHLIDDLFTQMNIALKDKVKLTARLKNHMPVSLRKELLLELKNINKKMHLYQLLWSKVHNSDSQSDSENIQILLKELKERNYKHYSEVELNIATYKNRLKKANSQQLKRLYVDYSSFIERFNFEQHVCYQESNIEKQAYLGALYTVASYFGLDYSKSIRTIAKKLGISQDISKVPFEKVELVCTDQWTLSAKTIDWESRNVYLLGEALLIIPFMIDEQSCLDSELLKSLRLSKKEVREIIHFTNLLKADAEAFTKPFLQIQKYNILKFYAQQFKQHAYKEVDMNNKILVIGTMSSGKSTFLNSLIGQDLFPSKNEACTARVFEYLVKDISNYVVKKGNGTKAEIFDDLSQQMISRWNESAGENPLTIIGPSKSVIKINKKITFIDTPGPNNSADQSHREVMKTALEGEYDKILYLLNSTQLGTEDDVVLLNNVKELLKKKGDLPIYFIVNKVDEFDNNSNESIATLRESVYSYLQAKGFEQPNILFVSALTSKLIQNELNGQALSRKERNQLRFFQDIMLEPAYNLTQYNIYNKQIMPNQIQFNENLTEDQIKLLIHSGMTEVLNCL